MEQVETLKKIANNENSKGENKIGHRPFSTYEALTTHVWRSACKARQREMHQPTVVRIVSNIRHKLKPQLPLRYSGNGVSRILTPISLFGDIIFKNLSYASQRIRDAIEWFTNEYVKSSMDFVVAQEHVDWTRERSKEVYFYGDSNLNIGSFLNIPVYDADFGRGKPMLVDGDVFIVPSSKGDGSVTITLALKMEHMDAFKRFFYESMTPKDQ